MLLSRRDDDAVGDQIVDEGKPEAAGMPHPVDLHRAGAEDHDRRARRLHVAVEIDQDVDAQIADAPGHLEMRQVAEVMVIVDAMAVTLVVIRIAAAPAMGRNRVNLEALAVMSRKEAKRHVAHRMIGEVRRHIGEPYLAPCGRWIGRRQGC